MTTLTAQSQILEETYDSVRNKDIRSTWWERIINSLTARKKFAGYPEYQRRALVMEYIIDNASTPVKEYDKILGRHVESVSITEGYDDEKVLAEWREFKDEVCFDFGHECLDWELLLEIGLVGMQERARKAHKPEHTEDQTVFLNGMEKVYAAIRRHIIRYSEEAHVLGMTEQARIAELAANGTPATFHEALQLIFFVGHIYSSIYAINSTISYGRMDQYLLPYYNNDISSGTMTRAEIKEVLEDFYCKNNLVMGRGEHQLDDETGFATSWLRNPMYDTPQYIILGGKRADGSATINDLTKLMIEQIIPRFKNPTIVLRYNEEWDDDTLKLAAEKILANSTMLTYNDDRCIPAWEHAGFTSEEAVEYIFNGCNWPTLPAKQTWYGMFEMINMPQILENILVGKDDFPQDIEDVYKQFTKDTEALLRQHLDNFKEQFADQCANPAKYFNADNLFMKGCVEEATPGRAGSFPYHNLKFTYIGMATITDAITALEEGIYSEKPLCSKEEMLQALKNNWQDQHELQARCKRLPKYGQDNDIADKHAVRLVKIVSDLTDKVAKDYAGDLGNKNEILPIYRSLQSDTECVWRGELVGALPHGRDAHTAISENTSPEWGAATKGITAQLNTIKKIQSPINSGALNLQLPKKLFTGEAGVTLLTNIMRTYFSNGGLQLQCSYVDIEELKAAQKCPEKYKDLMIRVTGYSTAFVELSKETQDYIMKRYI